MPVPIDQLKSLLDFEAGPPTGIPKGWSITPGKASVDSKIVHRGKYSARVESGGALTLMAQVPFSGEVITLRGFLKTESVTGFAGLWLRVDGNSGNAVGYDNMESQRLRGTTDWKQYSIEFPLAFNGTHMYFGAIAEGGTAWVDDLEVLIDGRLLWANGKIQEP